MPFSIWEYVRERTRDAVLAGFQDAFDIAEQGDTEGSQHAAANRLKQRLAAGSLPPNSLTGEPSQVEAQPIAEARGLPHPSVNGQHAAPQTAPSRPADASAFDDELESRLNSDAPQNGPGTPPHIGRARRGRPPKNRQA